MKKHLTPDRILIAILFVLVIISYSSTSDQIAKAKVLSGQTLLQTQAQADKINDLKTLNKSILNTIETVDKNNQKAKRSLDSLNTIYHFRDSLSTSTIKKERQTLDKIFQKAIQNASKK